MKNSLSEEEFMEQYCCSSLADDEVAYEAAKISDNENLSQKALDFLEARQEFLDALEEIDFEWG